MKTLRLLAAATVFLLALCWRWLFPLSTQPEALAISKRLLEDASRIRFSSSRQHFSEEWKRDGVIWTDVGKTQIVSQPSIVGLLGSLSKGLPTVRGLTPETSGLSLQDRTIEIETRHGGHYQIFLGLPLLDRSGVALNFGPYSPIQVGPIALENYFGSASKQHYTFDLLPMEVQDVHRFSFETETGKSSFGTQVDPDSDVGSYKKQWTWSFEGSPLAPRKFKGLAHENEILTLLGELKVIRAQESRAGDVPGQPFAKFNFWKEDSVEPYQLTISKSDKLLFASRGQTKALRLPSEGEVNFEAIHELLSQRSLLPLGSGRVTRLEFGVGKYNWVFLKNSQGWSKFNEIAPDSTEGNEPTDVQTIQQWLDGLGATEWQIKQRPVVGEKAELQFDTRMYDSKNNDQGRYKMLFYANKRLDVMISKEEIFSLQGDAVQRQREIAEKLLGKVAKAVQEK